MSTDPRFVGRTQPKQVVPAPRSAEQAWAAIQEELPGAGSASGVDWERRPFAKRWRLRRLGWSGLLEVLGEIVDLRTWGYALTPSSEGEHEPQRLQAALSSLRRDPSPGIYWFLAASGRFVFEWDGEDALALEFVRASNTRMLERLKAREAAWSGPPPRESVEDRLRAAFGEPMADGQDPGRT